MTVFGFLKRLCKYVIGAGLVFVIASSALVLLMRWVDPPSSAVIAVWQWSNERNANHQWRPIEQISSSLQLAVIASEDQKFPNHMGFDFESLQKALNEKRGRPRGASTITQQTAKNVFLWHGRSYLRKLLEAWFTVLMETFWPKQRILEVYLNVAEFGEGIYGAEAAAQKFFGTSAKQLTNWQAGLLAAVLPNPKRMSAARPSAYVRSRAVTITGMMEQLGGVSYIREL